MQDPSPNSEQDEGGPLPPTSYTSRYFTMQRIRYYFSRRLRSRVYDYDVSFHGLSEAEHEIPAVFQEIIDVITNNNPSQHVRLVLCSPSLSYPISIPFATASEISVEQILTRIQNVMNSNETFVLDDGIKINVFATANPTIAGIKTRTLGGIRKRHVIPLKQWIKKKRLL